MTPDPTATMTAKRRTPNEVIDQTAIAMLDAYLTARDALGRDIGPKAWVFLGQADDDKPVVLEVAPPSAATIKASAGRLTFLTICQVRAVREETAAARAAAYSYWAANGGSLKGYPGVDVRIIAVVLGEGSRMWSSVQPAQGAPWPRPTVEDAEPFAMLGALSNPRTGTGEG